MPPKRIQLHWTIAQKYDMVMTYEGGVPREKIREKYGITHSSLSTILRQSEKIKEKYQAIKKLGCQPATDLDRVLFHWYLRCKGKKVQMTKEEVQKIAVEINEKLNGSPGFKACDKWFKGFRERYRIHNQEIKKDLPIKTETAAGNFIIDFNASVQEYGVALENLYNVVYRAILWKAVPEQNLFFRNVNLEMCEDYVTALFCVNATGCHKLPVLIIGNIPEDHGIYNFKTNAFSTIYRYNPEASMNSNIFNQWYNENFLESVKERQGKNRDICMLLLDNTRSLHDLEHLNKIDPFVVVASIPSDVSPLRQPMNCGIIACFKRKYRKELSKTIKPLFNMNTEDELIDIHKELSMWDCCRIVHDAWSCVDHETLINSWDRLLNRNATWNAEYLGNYLTDVHSTVQSLRELPGCELCEQADVLNWFAIDDRYDIVMKLCSDQVFREYRNRTLGEVNIGIIEDQAGPSHL